LHWITEPGFVWVLENLESHGIVGRVVERHGKLHHYRGGFRGGVMGVATPPII